MYRLPYPEDKILKDYLQTYSPYVYDAINEFLTNKVVLEIPMGNDSKKTKYHFKCGLKIDSPAYNWIKGLLKKEKIEQLLIGNRSSMDLLKEEIEKIEPKFREKLTMSKYSIRKATGDKYVEDLNLILNEIFVKNLYEKVLNKSDVVKNKGVKICPYCASDILKSFRNGKGHFIKSQLDHYLPKSKYPFLAMNYFNLFPACKDCNMFDTGKGEKSPVSDDFKMIFLQYPHDFDASKFNFSCEYDGGALFDESSYNIDIDYHGNDNLKIGYNDIIPIHPFYQEMTHIPVEIMTMMHERQKEYVELASKSTGIEIEKFTLSIISTFGYSDNNDSAIKHEKHKFKVDLFKALIRYM